MHPVLKHLMRYNSRPCKLRVVVFDASAVRAAFASTPDLLLE